MIFLSRGVPSDRPLVLELLSPGGSLHEVTHTYTYSIAPLFTWYSDFCSNCIYGIRVCEFNQYNHNSLQDALTNWSLIPREQSDQYLDISGHTLSFQYPAEGHMELELGKHYVWQIRRSYEGLIETHYDYSPIYIFQIRSPSVKQLEFTDPYLSVIQSLIGKKQFNYWFNSGGELEGFITTGNSISINGEELHIETLYTLVSKLNQGKITLEKVRIK